MRRSEGRKGPGMTEEKPERKHFDQVQDASPMFRNDVKELRMVRADSLHPFQGDLKSLSNKNLKKLKKQIDTLGFSEPIVVWENDGVVNILNGHQRLIAIKSMNPSQEIPCIFVAAADSREAKKKVLALTSQYGQMTRDSLADFMEGAQLNWDEVVEHFRFPEVSWPGLETETVEDEITEVTPRVAVGDVWACGDHVVYCQDCRQGEVKTKVDLLVTDPPYGVDYAEKNEFLNSIDKGNSNQKPIENDNLSEKDMYKLWVDGFSSARKMLKGDASYYVTGPQGGDLLLLLQALKESGYTLKHMLIWSKNRHVLGRSDYNYKHEPIIYGWIKKHKFYGRAEVSVWDIPLPQKSKEHPTMKPVALYARAIGNSSKKGDLVLDPFAGSGTCLIASEQLGRRSVLFEIDPLYCDIIIGRWENLTGKKAKKCQENQ